MFDPEEIEHALWELEQVELEKWPDEVPYHTKFLREVIDRYEAETENCPTHQGKAARLLREADEREAALKQQMEELQASLSLSNTANARLEDEGNRDYAWAIAGAKRNFTLKQHNDDLMGEIRKQALTISRQAALIEAADALKKEWRDVCGSALTADECRKNYCEPRERAVCVLLAALSRLREGE